MFLIRHHSSADVILLKLATDSAAGANLSGAYLRGAQLSHVSCAGASLCGACLREADLRETDLRGADLRGADLRDACLEGARYDGDTRWPDTFQPAEHGCLLCVQVFRTADGLSFTQPPGDRRQEVLVLDRGVRLANGRSGTRVRRDGVARGKDVAAAIRAGWCWLWDDGMTSAHSAGGKGCELDRRSWIQCGACGQRRDPAWHCCPGCLQSLWQRASREQRRARLAEQHSACILAHSRELLARRAVGAARRAGRAPALRAGAEATGRDPGPAVPCADPSSRAYRPRG